MSGWKAEVVVQIHTSHKRQVRHLFQVRARPVHIPEYNAF